MKCIHPSILLALGIVVTLMTVAQADDPYDWPTWRGPEQNGISRETGIVDSFDPETKENILWQRDDLGTRSSPIVMNGKLYTMARAFPGTANEGERVICLDAATGETVWENIFPVYLSDVPDTRVGWSCVTGDPETGNVYANGVCGLFFCLDGATGDIKWSYPLHEAFGSLSTYGGRTNVPVVFEDLVITSAVVIGWGDMARPAHRFIAFDKKTGEVQWFNGTRPLPYDTTYSTPVVTVLNGQRAMVFGSGDGGVWAMQPRTGKPIWNYEFSRRGVNVTPAVHDGIVYIGHSEENADAGNNKMGSVVALKGDLTGDITKTGEIWKHYESMAGKSSPLIVGGRAYYVDDRAGLWIFDAKTGQQVGGNKGRANEKLGRVMRSSLFYADGKIYSLSNSGIFMVLKPTADGVEMPKRSDWLRLPGEGFGSPFVSHGRLYVTTSEAIICAGKPDQKPAMSKAPELPTEKKGSDKPAWAQVVPNEVLLAPGESQQYRVKLYNEMGQFLRESEAEFSVNAGGEISSEGKFTADDEDRHQAAIVQASVDGVKGEARVRIVPRNLPYTFDFENGLVPLPWVGMRFRQIVLDESLLDKFRQEDRLAHQLYVYLMTRFMETGAPALTIDNSTFYKGWSALLTYLDRSGQINNVDDAKEFFDPALKLLNEAGVIGAWSWSSDDKEPVRLTVKRGEREHIVDNGVMTKVERIPVPRGITKLGTRSRGWMGHTDMSDYTIQADFKATELNGKLPDMGLIAQGYTIDLQGAFQKLQVKAWVTQERLGLVEGQGDKVKIDFAWKPDVWYTIKFRASNQPDQVVLQGKVWPRDSEEPSEWTIEVVDPNPVRQGSPGFYGNARDAEYYIDNVRVTKNSAE